MKILYVDTENFWRGGQEQLFSLICGMNEAGHDIILASPGSAPLSQRVSAMGISTIDFKQKMELSPKALIRMYRLLKKSQVDIIHFNTPLPVLPGGLAVKLLSATKKRATSGCLFP